MATITNPTTKKKVDTLKGAVARQLFTNPVTIANNNAAAKASNATALDAAAAAAKKVNIPTGVTAQSILNNKPTVTSSSVQNNANSAINNLEKAAIAAGYTPTNNLTVKPTVMHMAGGALQEAANFYGISDQLKAANAYHSANNVANAAKDSFNEGVSAGTNANNASNATDSLVDAAWNGYTGMPNEALQATNDYQNYENKTTIYDMAINQEYERRLRELQEAEERRLREQEELKRQATQSAYDSNMAALLDAYTKRLNGINENYDTTLAQLGTNFDNSSKALSSDAERALQEAYVNRMMNEKIMRTQLNAQGISGGASESVIAGMLNNYANARNNIETNLADNVRSLREAYQKNLASALTNRNNALSDAEETNLKYKMQLENDLRDNIVGSYDNLYNGLANADANYYGNMAKLVYNQANNANELQNYAQKLLLNNNADLQNYADRLRIANSYETPSDTLAAYEQKLALQNQYNLKNTTSGMSTNVLRVLQKYNSGTMTDDDYESLTQEEKEQFIANM